MKIGNFLSEEQILSVLAERVKAARIRSGFTQDTLSKESGVGKSTIERLEQGKSIQLLNIIKILRTLQLLENLNLLIPSEEKTPMEYAKSASEAPRMRYRSSGRNSGAAFKWGDEE